jgi:endonuclease/exonuclease/phosphatase family metal-dependent hydrolase
MLLALGLVRWVGEGWWAVTLLLLMPRWLLLLPIGGLAGAGALAGRPSHWALQGAVALVVAGPLMGFSLPIRQVWTRPPAGETVRVMTYNLGQVPLDTRRLIAMIERERVDLVCFQEGSPSRPDLDAYFARGWYRDRQKHLASRYPIVADFEPMPEENQSEERYGGRLIRARVRTPSGTEFVLASVHLPTLRPGLNRVLGGDVRGLKIHLAWWRHELDRALRLLSDADGTPLILAGDFNMPSDDSTMAALGGSFQFAFAEAGWGYGYTRPSRYPWVRIDHILTSPESAVTRCWVGPDFGSDHLPLLAEVVLPSAAAAGARAR